MLRFLLVLTVASTVGLQGWRTLFNNFAVEVVHLDGLHIGMIQSIREVPGFLALLAVWVLLFIQEHRLSALSVVVLGAGTALTGFYPSYLGLATTTLVMSFGFHYYETVNQSLTLQYFDKQTAPLVFGAMRSLAAVSNVAVGVTVFLLASVTDYRTMFLLLGGLIVVLGAWGLRQDPVDRALEPQHKHMVFRRRYALFYFLTFMAGARRQVFAVFSVFLLVKVFAFGIREIAVLFVLNNVIGYFAGPWAGRAIVRYGERTILSVEYAGLIAVFLAYAFTSSK
ncbi:MAG TPA: MFS transporter, partial [Deferrisomatales bacterium]|nr:MFS transporter [Deferrisomatales bacterium]